LFKYWIGNGTGEPQRIVMFSIYPLSICVSVEMKVQNGFLADERLLKEFEWRFPRSDKLPCNPVADYSVEKYTEDKGWVSDDGLDLELGAALNERYEMFDY
jgi:hypothetical protein